MSARESDSVAFGNCAAHGSDCSPGRSRLRSDSMVMRPGTNPRCGPGLAPAPDGCSRGDVTSSVQSIRPLSVRWIVSALLICGVACFGTASASEVAQDRPEVEVTVTRGEEYQICKDIAAEYRRLRVRNLGLPSHCGIPLPTGNPEYVLIEWTDLDLLENLDVVKTMYYWRNFRPSIPSSEYYKQGADRSRPDPEFFALYWSEAEAQVRALIEAGKVELQHSRFDVDFSGDKEDLYRMTILVRDRGGFPRKSDPPPRVGVLQHCQNVGLPGAKTEYTYYTPPEDLPNPKYPPFTRRFLFDSGDFILWRGRPYWANWEGVVVEPTSSGGYEFPTVCVVKSKVKDGAAQ
jgi:hypothetical protein